MKLRFTLSCSILLVLFLFGFDSARAQTSEPWKNYVGAVQGSFPWGATNRNGFLQTTDGHINADAVNQVLQTHDLIFGQNDGLGSARDPVRVSAFMNGIRADKGAAWKAEVLTEANELIAAHKGKAHKVYWQLGNEVSAETFSETIRAWASAAGLPYPSPYTPFNDPQTPNDRGYIGYYIEYDVAPAIESLIAANAAAAPEDRIVIMTGSLANAAGSAARNSWLPAMLNYVIRGDTEQDSYVISTATPVSWANDALAVLFLNAGAAPRAVTSVSAASFAGSTLAAEAIVSAFGANLAIATQSATVSPLPTTLAGTTVKIRDGAGTERLSPLFFVSPTQINYQIPAATATGSATITVTSGDGSVSTGATLISTVAPGLFTANASGQGVAAAIALRIKADGSQSFEPIAQFDAAQNKFVAIPIDLGPDTDQVFLLLFGTGIRYRSSLSAVSAKIGGADGQVTFAGAQGGFVGLDQVNVRLSRNLIGRGDVDIALTVDAQAANTVKVTLK